jgi:Flp pilus assembly protein protease CpaA
MILTIFVLQIAIGFLGFSAAKVDTNSYLLPNSFTVRIFAMGVASQILDFRSDVIGAWLVVIVLHLCFALAVPRAFGLGDVKLMAGVSLIFQSGTALWLWIYSTYLLGLIHGIWRKISGKSSRIPFGVSIYGAWVLICMGEWAHVALDYGWRIPR